MDTPRFFNSAQGEIFSLMARKMEEIFYAKNKVSILEDRASEVDDVGESEKLTQQSWVAEEEARKLIGELQLIVGELANVTAEMTRNDFWNRADPQRGGTIYADARGWYPIEPRSWLGEYIPDAK